MANIYGNSYRAKTPRSCNFVAAPTPSIRRLGMFYRVYNNRTGEWVKYARYNPRHLPVIVRQYEFCLNISTGGVVLFLLTLERYDG